MAIFMDLCKSMLTRDRVVRRFLQRFTKRAGSYLGSLPIALFIASVVLATGVAGCASTQYHIKYDIDPADATVWPPPPEVPRYQYLGQITGEQNVVVLENQKRSTWLSDFFRWLVGLGGGSRAEPIVLQRPQSGVVDEQGRIYVTDVSRHSVFVFDGVKGTLSEWKSASATTDFITPVGIALGKDGNVLVADADLGRVIVLDQKGKPIGSFGEPLLKRPTGLARDPQSGSIYVADTHAHDIKVFNDGGEFIDIIGKRGTEIGEFNSPTHIALAHGNLYVTDTFNTWVQILTQSGDFKQQFGQRGIYLGNLVRPKGVASDSDGNIYVIESFYDHLLVYNSKGEFLLPVGGSGQSVGQFYLPAGVWIDNEDRVYIADMFNGRIVVLQYLSGKPRPQPPVR